MICRPSSRHCVGGEPPTAPRIHFVHPGTSISTSDRSRARYTVMCDTPSTSAMSLMLSFSTTRRSRISPSRASILRGRPFFALLSALMDVPKGGPKTGPHAIGLNRLAGLRDHAPASCSDASDTSFTFFHVFPPPLGWLLYTLFNSYLNVCNKFPKGNLFELETKFPIR